MVCACCNMFMLSYTSVSIMCLSIDDCSSKECCHTDIDDAVPGTDGENGVQSLLVFLWIDAATVYDCYCVYHTE